MSHSKGLFAGTCPSILRKYGRPHDGIQQWKCGRCGQAKNKRAPRCWIFHDFNNVGNGDHGYQKQKCGKCGDKRAQRISGCGVFRNCRWHNCSRIPGFIHCRRCGQHHP